MITFISDIITLIKINKIQSNLNYCFFVENNFIYQYLEPYIERKKNEDTIIISFEKLNVSTKKKSLCI